MTSRRPGYGIRHPELLALLAGLTPAAEDRVIWTGTLVLDVAAYPSPVPLPLPTALVTSVRCVVRVGGRIVVCDTPDGAHIWPGGRREPGEAYRATARREVYEETGWLIHEHELRELGFLHYRLVETPPNDHPYPHPDFLQVVYTAAAYDHADTRPADWVDLEGWERRHRLLTPAELYAEGLPPAQRAFLDLVAAGEPDR